MSRSRPVLKTLREKIKDCPYRPYYTGLILSMGIMLCSCHKELCFNHGAHALSANADVQLAWMQEWEIPYKADSGGFDWEQAWTEENWPGSYEDYKPELSDGVRTQIHTGDAQLITNNLKNTGGILPLPQAAHSLLFYSNDTEYIVFSNTENPVTATAGTRSRTRDGYIPPEGHEDEQTVNPPDMLYASYIPEHTADLSQQTAPLPVTMAPRTHAYLIRYRFKAGLEYVAQAKGALTGMASKAYLHDGHTDHTTATLLFDCQIDELGCTAKVISFGVPNFSYTANEYTEDAEQLHFVLNLEILLKNGKHLNYYLDVSKEMRMQPRGGILLFPDIEVSDEDGNESSGGFVPDIGDWEDSIDIPLPM